MEKRDRKIEIRVTAQEEERFKALYSNSKSARQADFLISILDFYELRDFPTLIGKLQELVNQPLKPSLIAHLSVLYTVLDNISTRLGKL